MDKRKIDRFCEEHAIDLLILFGSCAAGATHRESDVDVAVKCRRGAEVSKLELLYQLDDLFEGKPIDLVVLTADTDTLLLYEIFSRGRLLYERAPGSFEAEKLRAWKLYLDTEQLRAMQAGYLKEFIERVSRVA